MSDLCEKRVARPPQIGFFLVEAGKEVASQYVLSGPGTCADVADCRGE